MPAEVAKVLLEATLRKSGWDPSIDDQALDLLKIEEVVEEDVEVIGVDPSATRGVALRQSQFAGVSCRTGVSSRHDFLPSAVGEEDHVVE